MPPVNRVGGPWLSEAEWLISSRDLCRLIGKVRDLDLMQINPGLADRANWDEIAYKGGSETGVLNMTSLVTDAEGQRFCLTATWNDAAALDEPRFYDAYKGSASWRSRPGDLRPLAVVRPPGAGRYNPSRSR